MSLEKLQNKQSIEQQIMSSYVDMRLASIGWVAQKEAMERETVGTTNLAKIGAFTLRKSAEMERMQAYYGEKVDYLNSLLESGDPLRVTIRDARDKDSFVKPHTPFMRHFKNALEPSGPVNEITGEVISFGVFGFTVDCGEEVYTVSPVDILHANETVSIELQNDAQERLAA